MKLIRKRNWCIGVLSLLTGSVFAGPIIDRGIEFNEVEMYRTAKEYLLKGIRVEGASAEAYYYLGDTYLMLEQVDSAMYYFNESKAANPKYMLAMVGEGKVALKNNNLAAAQEIFKQAIKDDKKNPTLYTAIAAAYVSYGLFDQAPAMYQKARSVKKNYPNSFVVEGDMLAKQGKAGDACQRYENAKYFNKENKQAYLKEARVYKNVNTTMALEILDKLVAMDPDYVPAYIEYADIFYTTNFKRAIESYEKFVNEPGISARDIERYATVLYFSKNYQESLDQIAVALKQNPENFIMRRIQLYNHFDMGNTDVALDLANQFFSSKKENEEYIAQDYLIYGKLLDKNDQDSVALIYLAKAIELDPANFALYKDIASVYEDLNQYKEAIEYHEKYMAALESPRTSDFYSLGRAYYQAGSQLGVLGDSIAKEGFLLKADEQFKLVAEQNPDSYLGFFWSARALASLDPELKEGLAKSMYEETVAKLLAPENSARKSELTECYMYLGNYYYLNENKVMAKEYLGKVLELNPENEALRKAVNEL